jgi:hypothetical protein
MKRIFLFTVAAFLTLNSFSQSLPKGSLVGVHHFTVNLNGTTTLQEFMDFQKNKWAPAAAKVYGCEIHYMKHVRGENENKVGLIMIFKTEAQRNKFYDQDGKLNDAGKAANAKLKAINDESNKLGTTTGAYTDWIVE